MSLVVDEMIDYSKNKHSLNYLVTTTGEFIIPLRRGFGKSRHQLVLGRLQDGKIKRRRENVMGNEKGKW